MNKHLGGWMAFKSASIFAFTGVYGKGDRHTQLYSSYHQNGDEPHEANWRTNLKQPLNLCIFSSYDVKSVKGCVKGHMKIFFPNLASLMEDFEVT